MTLIIDVLSRVARQVSLSTPQSWLSAAEDEYVEIRDDFLLETVDDILERVDLPSPFGKVTTITGTGAETYALPADFKRLQRDRLAVYDDHLDRPCIPMTEDGDWTVLKDLGATGVTRFYQISGFEGDWDISFYENPSSAVEIKVHYVSRNWMANSGGTQGHEFTDAGDVLLFPRRVVEAGIVLRWRERKGLDFQSKLMEYETLLQRMSNDTRGRRVINFGEPDKSVHWTSLVPSYIPGS